MKHINSARRDRADRTAAVAAPAPPVAPPAPSGRNEPTTVPPLATRPAPLLSDRDLLLLGLIFFGLGQVAGDWLLRWLAGVAAVLLFYRRTASAAPTPPADEHTDPPVPTFRGPAGQ